MPGIIERGTVIASSEGSVDVRLAGGSACESCGACCHVDRDGVTVEGASDKLGAAVGDEVEVEIPEGSDTRAGVIVFIVPAVGLLVGYLVGYLAARCRGRDRRYGRRDRCRRGRRRGLARAARAGA